jgi:hypothetical protein
MLINDTSAAMDPRMDPVSYPAEDVSSVETVLEAREEESSSCGTSEPIALSPPKSQQSTVSVSLTTILPSQLIFAKIFYEFSTLHLHSIATYVAL